jgi:sugar fermentation stimulation protein A
VEIAGESYSMHINNTGRLEEFLTRGRKAFCFWTGPEGKTAGRLFAIEERRLGALIDTQLQMKAFERMVEEERIPWLKNCSIRKRNPRLGSSVLDYELQGGQGRILLEVKSAVMREEKFATYPDCPTTRGQRHVRELTEYSKKGGAAMIVFMAGLPEVAAFKPSWRGDRLLSEYLKDAHAHGVKIKSINLCFDTGDNTIHLIDPDLPVVLGDS